MVATLADTVARLELIYRDVRPEEQLDATVANAAGFGAKLGIAAI